LNANMNIVVNQKTKSDKEQDTKLGCQHDRGNQRLR
jgi:hypothetical protein